MPELKDPMTPEAEELHRQHHAKVLEHQEKVQVAMQEVLEEDARKSVAEAAERDKREEATRAKAEGERRAEEARNRAEGGFIDKPSHPPLDTKKGGKPK